MNEVNVNELIIFVFTEHFHGEMPVVTAAFLHYPYIETWYLLSIHNRLYNTS